MVPCLSQPSGGQRACMAQVLISAARGRPERGAGDPEFFGDGLSPRDAVRPTCKKLTVNFVRPARTNRRHPPPLPAVVGKREFSSARQFLELGMLPGGDSDVDLHLPS